jgi:hypothetical protein
MNYWVTCFVSVIGFLFVGCSSTATQNSAFVETQGLTSRDYWVCVANTSGYVGNRREAIGRCLEGKEREQSTTQPTTN